MRPKVVLADDIPKSLAVWKGLLEGMCQVVATAADGPSALEAIRHFKPEVAILDIEMPGMSGFEVARIVLTEHPEIGVILCSVIGDPDVIEAAANMGVRGYVSKVNVSHQLMEAVSAVAGGGRFFPPPIPLPYTPKEMNERPLHDDRAIEPANTASQVQIADALRESEYRLRRALEANSEGVWDWNLQTGQAYFSEGYAHILGYESKEFPTDYGGWKELVHPDDFERVNREHAAHIHEDKAFCIEFRMRHKTGEWRWLRSRGTVIERDAAGNAVRMVGTHLDITEYKRLEKELHMREWELSEAQRLARVGSWTRDQDGVLKWSKEMYRIHGRDPLLGPPTFEETKGLLTPASWEQLKINREGTEENEVVPSLDLEIIRPDGTRGWIATHSERERDATGHMVWVRGTAHDITERKEAEWKLREYERAIENVEEMIVVVDRDYRFVIANRAFLNFHDRTADQVIGHLIPEIVDRQVFEEVIKKNLERNFDGQSARFEVTYARPGYGRRTVFASQLPIEGPHGVDRVLAVLQDITERKKIEEELRDQESALREAQRIAHIGSWTWDPQTDAVTWSEEISTQTKWDRNMPVPTFREHAQFFEAEDFRKLDELVQRALRTGEPYSIEMEGRRTDGSKAWFVTRGEVVYNADGTLDHLRGTFQDLTERHLAEIALKESEERFRSIADTAPVMIWMQGADKRITYLNKQWLEFTGTNFDSVLGWVECIHPEDTDRVTREYEDAFCHRSAVTLQYRLRRHDRQYRWVIDTAVPRFEADGSFAGFVGSCIDDTERRAGEEVLRGLGSRLIDAQERERKRVARELHDDINQRLALLGMAIQQLGSNPGLTATKIRMEVNKLSALVTDISLEVQALSHRLHSSSLDYLGLAAAIRGLCDEIMRRHEVVINYEYHDIPRSLPPQISLALFRVTQEALQNAIKYSGVRDFTVRLLGSPDQVLLTVRDEGVGFAIENAMHGQGLGLVSMRERIAALQGTLSIVSEPNHGTEIAASVPLAEPRSDSPLENTRITNS